MKNPRVAVRAIILDEVNRILLLKRSLHDEFGDLWCLPGGKVDFGQTAKEAIAKEIQEETSLICSYIKFLFYQDSLPQNSGEKHYLNLYFKCQVDGEIKLSEESSDFVWVGPAELIEYDIAFKNDEAIMKYWKGYIEILLHSIFIL